MTYPVKSNITRIMLLVCGLLGCSVAQQAYAANNIYKWVDANGEMQYTQFPPPEGVEVIDVQTQAPPTDNSARERAKLQKQVEASEEQRKKQQEAETRAAQQADIDRITKDNCVKAKKNLVVLQQGGEKRYMTSEGEVLRLTEEDRQQRIAEANKQIQEFCKE
jgi:hypothetical protein